MTCQSISHHNITNLLNYLHSLVVLWLPKALPKSHLSSSPLLNFYSSVTQILVAEVPAKVSITIFTILQLKVQLVEQFLKFCQSLPHQLYGFFVWSSVSHHSAELSLHFMDQTLHVSAAKVAGEVVAEVHWDIFFHLESWWS